MAGRDLESLLAGQEPAAFKVRNLRPPLRCQDQQANHRAKGVAHLVGGSPDGLQFVHRQHPFTGDIAQFGAAHPRDGAGRQKATINGPVEELGDVLADLTRGTRAVLHRNLVKQLVRRRPVQRVDGLRLPFRHDIGVQKPFGVPPLHRVGLGVQLDEAGADRLKHPLPLLAQFILALVCGIVAPVGKVDGSPRLVARRLQVDQGIGPEGHPAQRAPVAAITPPRDTIHHRPTFLPGLGDAQGEARGQGVEHLKPFARLWCELLDGNLGQLLLHGRLRGNGGVTDWWAIRRYGPIPPEPTIAPKCL